MNGRWGFRVLSRLLIFCFASLGILFVLVTVSPLVSWWARGLAGEWDDPSGGLLIVLGGSTLEGGLIGENSYWRSVYAVRAWREGGFQAVILSGGGPERRPIVEPMRHFLECQGVPGQSIRMEIRSQSTRENALFTRDLLAGVTGRKVLLTSDYHMFRASRAFRKVGLDVLPRPYPDALRRGSYWKGRWPAFLDLVVETAKIAYYYARGWI